jgi:hypothetical protein
MSTTTEEANESGDSEPFGRLISVFERAGDAVLILSALVYMLFVVMMMNEFVVRNGLESAYPSITILGSLAGGGFLAAMSALAVTIRNEYKSDSVSPVRAARICAGFTIIALPINLVLAYFGVV